MTEANNQTCSAAVFISGGGTNLQAFIDAVAAGSLALKLNVVISNRSDAGGLERAKNAGIPTVCVDHLDFPERAEFDRTLALTTQNYAADVIILAGFMRILTPVFIDEFAGRIFNIHPSLLPRFPGLDTHRRAIDTGDQWHGSTVHFVTEQLDGGPRIIQGKVPVLTDDSVATLAARVLEVEHQIYPHALALYAAGRLRCEDGDAWLDGERLEEPLQIDT